MVDPTRATTVAVYICESNGHVGDAIDLDAVTGALETHPAVRIVRTHELLCGPDGHEVLRDDIETEQPDRIVVGGGSLTDKRPDYEDLLASAGMNPFLLQMVDLREHCAWVTEEQAAATAKATRLLRAAVERALHLEPIEAESVAYDTDVLVAGDAPEAIEAARQLSVADRTVYLVTAADSPGGRLVRQEFLYPDDACAPCQAAPKLEALQHSDDVEVIAPATIDTVRGTAGTFEVSISERPRYVDPEACMPCDRCVEACPVSVPDAFEFDLTDRAAIYQPFAGAVPGGYVIDEDACLRFGADGEDCTACAEACPMDALRYDEAERTREITVGNAIVAPEAEPYDADRVFPAARDGETDVYTGREFERLFTESGPTDGAVVCRDGSEPDSVAIVHCVGSRCDAHLPYCSGTCCQDALTLGRALREAVPDCQVYQIYDDLVVPGTDGEAYARETFERGVTPLHWRLDHGDAVDLTVDESGVTVAGTSREGDRERVIVDAVVLAMGTAPPDSLETVAEVFDLERDEHGFLSIEQPWQSTTQASEGIYVAGPATGPVRERAGLTASGAAVGEVLSRAVPGREVTLEAQRATIDQERCTGCRICIETCPYDAIERDEDRGVAVLRDRLCQGCGACVASCPTGAIDQRNFRTAQLRAEIGGLLEP